jgi:membrane-bound lytic murein transglycosylase D
MARARSEHGTDFGRIVRNYQGPAFKFASRNYYAEFLAAREIATHPDKYFPGIVLQQPMSEERIVLQQSMPATQLASQYGVSVDRLAAVNLAWLSSARSGRANLPAGHTVWLPAGASRGVAGQSAGDSVARIGAFEAPVRSTGPKSLVVVEGGDRGEAPARTQPRVSEAPPTVVRPVAPVPAPVTFAKAKTDKPAPLVAPRRQEITAKADPIRNEKVGKTGAAKEDKATLAKNDKATKDDKTGKPGAKDAKSSLAKNDKAGKDDKTGKPGSKNGKDDKVSLAKTDKSGKSGAKEDKAALAKNEKAGKAGATKDDKAGKATPKASREHVVQANETLFRVATRYDLSVDQLRRMNGMTGKDNSIRPGQRLRVSI